MIKKIGTALVILALIAIGYTYYQSQQPVQQALVATDTGNSAATDPNAMNPNLSGLYTKKEYNLYAGKIDNWSDYSNIPLNPQLKAELSWKCFEVWEASADKKIVYINAGLCTNFWIGYWLYNIGDQYIKIWRGQEQIPDEIRLQYNIPETFNT